MSDFKKEIKIEEQDIDNVMALLDEMTASGVGRLKVKASEELKQGETKKAYHHGRCDIGSPWACGTAFDVLE
ncbi:MAG: hypothetical protein E7294_09770 [Lachnospiraceae bacterium]|nr:hypothetical protein [Lachnospiraceae bacterium]